MHHGRLADAQRQFAAGVDLAPNEFWPNYQAMRCSFELQQFDDALISANVCVALQPKRTECYYNRALCQLALKHDQPALDDFGRSLQLDPTFAPTLLSRGKLLGQLNRFSAAQADLEAAAIHGARPAEAHYQLARLSLAQNDLSQASRWLQSTLVEEPNNADAIALQKKMEPTSTGSH